MKYLKLFEAYICESRIPRIRLNGEYYHGSVIQNNEFFNDLDPSYSGWDAVWFSSEESVSQEFSEEACRDEDNEVKVLFKVNIKCTGIADINYELFKEIIDKNSLYDPREYIKILIDKGFNGWLVPGSLGHIQYDDIAIFNTDCFKVIAAKFYFNQKFNHEEE